MTRHGRTPEQWQQLVDAATKSLTRKAELNRLSSYTELNRDIAAKTGQPGFDFSSPEGRNAMGDLLGDAVEKTYPDKRVMLSALVPYVDANRPGGGFYNLAASLELLDKDTSMEEKEAFWYSHVEDVYKAYSKKTRK